MKKDKKWAQREVDRYLSYEGVNEARNALVFAKGVINLLDESEVTLDKAFEKVAESYSMTKEEIWRHLERIETYEGVLSQEWIDNNSINASSDGITEEYVHVDDLQNLIVPKQDLPLIPRNVADWITKYRDILDLYPALRRLEDNPLIWDRIYEWYRMNTHQFVNAYLTGDYEVEEEQKYYVLGKHDTPILIRDYMNQISETSNLSDIYPKADSEDFEFTEQEIRDYDERYFVFAVPVEVEE